MSCGVNDYSCHSRQWFVASPMPRHIRTNTNENQNQYQKFNSKSRLQKFYYFVEASLCKCHGFRGLFRKNNTISSVKKNTNKTIILLSYILRFYVFVRIHWNGFKVFHISYAVWRNPIRFVLLPRDVLHAAFYHDYINGSGGNWTNDFYPLLKFNGYFVSL